MDSDYVQSVRYKLQKRFRKLNGADWKMFPSYLRQFWDYCTGQLLITGILTDLEARSAFASADVEKVFSREQVLIPESEEEATAFSYLIVKRCAETPRGQGDSFEMDIGLHYGGGRTNNENVEKFREYFVEPLYEYIDEQLDDQRAVLSLIVKYKQRCEWFHRGQLFSTWETNRKAGEKLLALDLYEYLHDQGIEFHIEPSSVSGKIDLIAAQESGDPLLADAKIFDPGTGHGTPYLASGVNQIYIYTLDYNKPVGYLVIFKTCANDVRLALPTALGAIPFLCHNNKTIFFIVIDLFPHGQTAAKRGPIRPIEITQDDLMKPEEKAAMRPGAK